MAIIRFLLLWLLSLLFTSAIDAFWHLVIFRRPYVEGLKPLGRTKAGKLAPKGGPGLLAQVMVVTSLVVLVLVLGHGSAGLALVVGALAGVLAISVYGVTNYSLFKDWNLTLTVLELVWGPVLGGLSGLFVYWARSWLWP